MSSYKIVLQIFRGKYVVNCRTRSHQSLCCRNQKYWKMCSVKDFMALTKTIVVDMSGTSITVKRFYGNSASRLMKGFCLTRIPQVPLPMNWIQTVTKDVISSWSRLRDYESDTWEGAEVLILYHSLGNFSRQQIDDIFFLFFPENRIWHFMQIVSNILFFGKNKENISKCFLL